MTYVGGSNINRPLSVATSLWARLGSDLERCCGEVWRPFSTLSLTLPSSQLFGIKMSERAVLITVAQRVVMKFLANENVGPDEIWRRLRAQYGESTLSKTQVKYWHKEFRGGRDALQNTRRQRCPRTGITPRAPFPKLWSADHRWSSGSALVVLFDWTLVQKRQKKYN
jgi:hypothetical protein